jgi:hypothetical protein
VPAAIKSLAAHLGEAEATSWRAALLVFELSYGKPAETIELDPVTLDPFQVAAMSQAERGILLSRVLEQHTRSSRSSCPKRLRSVEE